MSLHAKGKAARLELLTTDDGCVLLDIQHDRLLKLNLIAAEMWALLSSGHAEAEIVSRLAEKYHASEDLIAADLTHLMRRIGELGLTGVPVSILSDLSRDRFTSRESFPWYGAVPSSLPTPSRRSVLAAFLGLALFDLVLSVFSLRGMCWCVRSWPSRKSKYSVAELVGVVCNAVHRACVWYPKQTLCLQRSAVTTCLLRAYGVQAVMTIGVRSMPFLAHAWVEVDGSVVNDWPRVKQFYQPLLSN